MEFRLHFFFFLGGYTYMLPFTLSCSDAADSRRWLMFGHCGSCIWLSLLLQGPFSAVETWRKCIHCMLKSCLTPRPDLCHLHEVRYVTCMDFPFCNRHIHLQIPEDPASDSERNFVSGRLVHAICTLLEVCICQVKESADLMLYMLRSAGFLMKILCVHSFCTCNYWCQEILFY